MGNRDSPEPGGSTKGTCWRWVGGVGTGGHGGFPVPWARWCLSQRGHSSDMGGCWLQGGPWSNGHTAATCRGQLAALQHAQNVPEGARSSPRQRNAGLGPHPLYPRLQPSTQGPRQDFGTKGSIFFQPRGPSLSAELAFSSVSAWDLPPHC